MPKATQTDTTPTTAAARGLSFADRMVEMSTGINLLIDHLDKAFDAGFELDMKVGSDVMDAIIATQWVAKRLDEDIHTVACEFDQDEPQPSIVKFAQAAE